MKAVLLLILLALSGCSTSRVIAVVKHADGSGSTTYRSIATGGIVRPGVIVLVSETVGSNAPVVLTQASGSPLMPSVISASGIVGAAATLGSTLKPDTTHNSSSTTIVEPGAPPSPPSMPSRPPFGPPPWHGQHPNRGH